VKEIEISEAEPSRTPRNRGEPFETHSPLLSGRRGNRIVQPAAKAFAAFALVIAATFGTLLLVTPPAHKAAAIARAQAGMHGGAYQGSPPPERFAEALVATEDQRFYSSFDPGIDPIALLRASFELLTGHRGDPGGSTISQQLAKMLYTPGRADLAAKLEQVALAIKLNFTYSKTQILSMYAEVAYFGDGYYGLSAASCGYFGRQPVDLTWPQAAMLAGVVNAPTADDPRTRPEAAASREAHVFRRLVAVGDLTKAQGRAALGQTLGLVRADTPETCRR
jgi:membrane carboxypeptidase/penicillin-binding protein PbpC